MLLQNILQIFQKRTRLLKLLIASSLLAIIPVVLFGSVSYFVVNYSLQNEISNISSQTMVLFQERVDEKLRALDKVVLQQTFNPIIDDVLFSDNPLNDFTEFNKVWNMLYSIKLIRDDIDTIYLYPSNNKWLISLGDSGVGLSENAQLLDPEIKNSINSNSNKPYFWMDRKAANGANIITLVRRMPILSSYPLGYLIVDINENELFNVFNNTQFEQSGEMLALTPSGNILSSNKNHVFNGGQSTAAFVQQFLNEKVKNNIVFDKVNKSRMMISFIKSPYSNWQYMFIVPLKALDDRYQLIKEITLGLCGLMIVVIIIASLMMTKSFYRVIQNIIDIIKRKNSSIFQTQNKIDEFDSIGRYLETVHSKSDSMEEEIHQMKSLLRVNFLQRLLIENYDRDEIEEKFKYYGITKESNYFTVICIELDIKSENENKENMLIFSVMNVVKEITNHYGAGSIIMIHPNCCAMIFNHKPSEDNLQNTVFHMAEEIRSVIERLTEITVTIGVGRCYEGVDKIHCSYNEAAEALQYQILKGNGTVIFIGQINPVVHDYVYPIRQEQTLIKNLKMCNITKVYELLDEFALLLKTEKNSNYEYVQQSFYQLIASSLKVLYEFGMEHSLSLFSYNIYQHLSGIRTIEQIVLWSKTEFYPVIIENITKSRGLQNHDTVQKALNYIHLHYNEDLSQSIVSELVSIPSSQFSKFFKEEVGMTFTDYIIMYRMERAKEILLKTDQKIGDIATYLRYNNSQNFIRVFKQFTGSTPKEYKEQHGVLKKLPKHSTGRDEKSKSKRA
ncbi:helix-turn-helix domain-containing protein [Cohnella silvisoli]|uniref:Helix-turn-helix domain-containing protein n=1 Tax=Cohnella silvisoli TaxID=2873699 RepID=A0ABV1KQP5_9BACL|nr:helix-turn-helix domain-containing protein [Cohnella silvisoli]MCD9024648.1 helix-turn-helix domain-containing protein [Cohnella silvisoli]